MVRYASSECTLFGYGIVCGTVDFNGQQAAHECDGVVNDAVNLLLVRHIHRQAYVGVHDMHVYAKP